MTDLFPVEPPTDELIIKAAIACRIAQKRYFADRNIANLQIAKVAEGVLDKALKAWEAAQ